jgi:hypothetical protein
VVWADRNEYTGTIARGIHGAGTGKIFEREITGSEILRGAKTIQLMTIRLSH